MAYMIHWSLSITRLMTSQFLCKQKFVFMWSILISMEGIRAGSEGRMVSSYFSELHFSEVSWIVLQEVPVPWREKLHIVQFFRISVHNAVQRPDSMAPDLSHSLNRIFELPWMIRAISGVFVSDRARQSQQVAFFRGRYLTIAESRSG